MRVLAIQTSPTADGLTARSAKCVLASAAAAGHETEFVNLPTIEEAGKALRARQTNSS